MDAESTAEGTEVIDDIDRRNAPLRTEIELVRGGVGDAVSVRRTLRESVLYLLRAGDADVMATQADGIRWVYAFTTRTELARFAALRGGRDASVDYVTVRGDRLLDAGVPSTGTATGIAVDVAGDQPMLFPPVRGIVPDRVAVDLSPEAGRA
jgi:hypothetical protein